MENTKYLFFDTETTGLIEKGAEWWTPTKLHLYPYICSIAWITLSVDKNRNILEEAENYHLLQPCTETGEEIVIHPKAFEAHKLTIEMLKTNGRDAGSILDMFLKDAEQADIIIGHNSDKYDIQLLIANAIRYGVSGYQNGKNGEKDDRRAYHALNNTKRFDTMTDNRIMQYVNIYRNNRLKWPTVSELIEKLNEDITIQTELNRNDKIGKALEGVEVVDYPHKPFSFQAHNALEDIRAVKWAYFMLHNFNIL